VTFKKHESSSVPGEGLVPLITSTQISERGLNLTAGLSFVPAERVKPEQRLLRGDIVVAASSGSAAVVGKSAMVSTDWPGTFGAFCAVLRPGRSLDPRYIALYVGSPEVRRTWSRLAAGTNINNLRREHLTEVVVPLAPLAEQGRIVAAIEEHLSRLDAANVSLTSANARLRQFRGSALTDAFSGEWPREPMAAVTDPDRPIRYGILMPKEHVEDGVLYVRVKDYPSGTIELEGLRRTSTAIAEQYRRATLHEGDVLLAIRGTYGRVAIVPPELQGGNITQDTARIAPLPHLDPRFLAAYLRSGEAQSYFRRVARGVAVKGVNIGDLRTMPVPIPPLADQLGIVAEVEHRLLAVDAVGVAIEQGRRRATMLRRAVLDRAFGGKLVPQDPSEEPASVLLDNIRSERQATPAKPLRRRVRT
jgi:type I restriction enzyme S subunit